LLLDWAGELVGDWRVDEPLELLELLELLDEFDEFDEFEDELDELVPDEAPDEVEVLLSDDVPESLVAAWVAPGRTSTTAPASATLATDAVTVVAVSRRLPCSRSATARASCRALSWPAARSRSCGARLRSSQLSMSISVPRPAEGPVRARSRNPLSAPGRALLAQPGLESWGNAQRRLLRRLPRGS
jgi:hypothetical protein